MLTSGDPAPTFELPSIDGTNRALEQGLEAGPVLVAFFALDCQTCDLCYLFWDRMHGEYAEAGWQLWALALDAPDEVGRFVEDSGVEFPVLLDADRTIVRAYGAMSTPAMYLVAADGTIESAHEGFDRAAINDLARRAAEATGREAIEIAAGEAPEMRPGCVIHNG